MRAAAKLAIPALAIVLGVGAAAPSGPTECQKAEAQLVNVHIRREHLREIQAQHPSVGIENALAAVEVQYLKGVEEFCSACPDRC